MKRLFAMLMALVLVLGAVPTQIRAEEVPTVTAIQITTLPAKTLYTSGEELDVTGGRITATYSDGTTQTVDMTADMVTGFNSTVSCVQTLTVSYSGQEAYFDVTVTAPVQQANTAEVYDITIAVIPTKIQYIVNQDELDVTGGMITVTYMDDTTANIPMTADMVTNFDNTSVGTRYLSVCYADCYTGYTIAVVESEDKPLVIRDYMDIGQGKTFYYVGEPLCVDGATLTLEYSDGHGIVIDITEDMVVGFDTSEPGHYPYQIRYENGIYGMRNYTVVSEDMLSGDCGGDTSWNLSKEGVLTISGSGEVTDAPWQEYWFLVKSLVVENGITELPDFAFRNHTGLTTVSLPNTLESIGNFAFEGCTGLNAVSLPDSLDSIRSYAFYGCTGLTAITFPDSVKEIDYCAFEGCTGLTKLTIPKTVTYLGGEAFANCTGLKTITFEALSAPSSSIDVFDGVTATVYYPGTADWDWFKQYCGGDLEWVSTNGETAQGLRLEYNTTEIYVGGGFELFIYAVPGYLATDCDIAIDSNVLSLQNYSNGYCYLTAVKPGTATVTVTDKLTGHTASVTVTIKAPQEISFPFEELFDTETDDYYREYLFTPTETVLPQIVRTAQKMPLCRNI